MKNNNDEPKQLAPQPTDYVTSAVKAALGAIPFAGSLLAEIAGTVIPNQRIDRIAKFAATLEYRLSNIEEEYVRGQLKDEGFTDLIEEGLRQASRSLSDERREYIANVITNGLSPETINYIESKHLMRILGELNDVEITWLKSHDLLGNTDEFWGKHRAVVEPVMATMKDPPLVLDKEALQNSYQGHLSQLGLLEKQYKIDNKTKLPVYDSGGKPVIAGYEITLLGRLLLCQIGLSDTGSD